MTAENSSLRGGCRRTFSRPECGVGSASTGTWHRAYGLIIRLNDIVVTSGRQKNNNNNISRRKLDYVIVTEQRVDGTRS